MGFPTTPKSLLDDILTGMVTGQLAPTLPRDMVWLTPVDVLPAANAKRRGKLVLLETPGADDALWVCMRLAAGTYIWKKVV